jgi:hypothetical protein
MYRALILAAFLLPAAACASAQAKAPVEPAPLDVPQVPPRVIDATPLPEPTDIPPVEELPSTAANPAPPRPRPAPRAPAETPKPETKPETAPDTDASSAPPPTPVPPLRPGTSANGPEAERQIREILVRAKSLLEGVDRNSLSDERKANYDSARDSIKNAEDFLKASNWVLARSVAERAEKIAKLLSGR